MLFPSQLFSCLYISVNLGGADGEFVPRAQKVSRFQATPCRLQTGMMEKDEEEVDGERQLDRKVTQIGGIGQLELFFRYDFTFKPGNHWLPTSEKFHLQ